MPDLSVVRRGWRTPALALSLLLGRPLSEDEFPVQQALVESVKEYRDGEAAPLS